VTDEPNGRALAEAAARAMGWRSWHDGPVAMAMGPGWVEPDGTIHGVDANGGPDITEREMLAWLHDQEGHLDIHTSKDAVQAWFMRQGSRTHCRYGPTLRDALMRLVVVVAEREAANG